MQVVRFAIQRQETSTRYLNYRVEDQKSTIGSLDLFNRSYSDTKRQVYIGFEPRTRFRDPTEFLIGLFGLDREFSPQDLEIRTRSTVLTYNDSYGSGLLLYGSNSGRFR